MIISFMSPPSDLLGLSKNSSKAILDVLSQTPEILTLASSVSSKAVSSQRDKVNVRLSATLWKTVNEETINYLANANIVEPNGRSNITQIRPPRQRDGVL